MAVDPTIVVAGIGAWASIMGVVLKGAVDSRHARHNTNGPITEIAERVARIEERTARTEERTARIERAMAREIKTRQLGTK